MFNNHNKRIENLEEAVLLLIKEIKELKQTVDRQRSYVSELGELSGYQLSVADKLWIKKLG